MDDQRFDRLAKQLAAPQSRRRALRTLIATAAGTLAFREAGVDAARNRSGTAPRCRRGKCKDGLVCCAGYCHATCDRCVNDDQCDDGKICTTNNCIDGHCKTGEHLCAPSEDPCFVNLCIEEEGGCITTPQKC